MQVQKENMLTKSSQVIWRSIFLDLLQQPNGCFQIQLCVESSIGFREIVQPCRGAMLAAKAR